MFNVITAIVISAAAVLGTWLGVHEIAQNQDDATRALLIKNGVDPSLAVGASAPISALTEKTTLQGSDTMVIVDNGVSPATTKKITVTNATTSMKGYWDSVYSPIFSTSAGLRGLLSDETGSGGAAVFATGPTISGAQLTSSPTLTTPVINVGSDATGDLYYRNSGGLFTRLPAGSSNEFLRISGGIPDWDNTALLTNPQTASSTFTATTTIEASNLLNKALILNGLAYKWPSARGASSTVPRSDASGNLIWDVPPGTIATGTISNITDVPCIVGDQDNDYYISHTLGATPGRVKITADINAKGVSSEGWGGGTFEWDNGGNLLSGFSYREGTAYSTGGHGITTSFIVGGFGNPSDTLTVSVPTATSTGFVFRVHCYEVTSDPGSSNVTNIKWTAIR